MSWQASIDKENERIEIVTSGSVSKDDMVESRKIVEQAYTHEGITRVLVDFRQLEKLPAIVDLFDFGVSLSHLNKYPAISFAMIAGIAVESNLKFLENVGRNRGVVIRLFKSIDEADTWLAK